jgi:hypothetical protein
MWRAKGIANIFPVAGGWHEMKKNGFEFAPESQKRELLLK